MKILVACEESQAVCKELRRLGHEAYSCDIQECSGGHPEWHINDDVLAILGGNCSFKLQNGSTASIQGRWDMIIAFPPCTHLATSGARHFFKKRKDGRQRGAIEFFCKFLYADCEKIAIENPVGIISGDYVREQFPDLAEKYSLPREHSQIIQPWMFGETVPKSTCLWLKGLPKLKPLITEPPEMDYVYFIDKKTGRQKRRAKWYANSLNFEPGVRSKIRSKTFPGVAKAMAEQWAGENVAPAYEQGSLF